jgi:antitoxin YefM
MAKDAAMNAVPPTAHKPQPETAVDVELRVMFCEPSVTCALTLRTGILYACLGTNRHACGDHYTSLRERLASVLDQVADDHEVVIVRRRHAKDVALVPADELTSLLETAHLLRSPKNAQRLLAALQRATRGKGKPEPVDKLRREMGLGSAR